LLVGSVELVPLVDAVGVLGELEELFPETSDWDAERGRHPELFAGSQWRIPCTSYLVRSGGTTLLVDTAVGPAGLWGWNAEWEDGLLPALAEEGAAPEDVDVVFLTHLHIDHVGWNLTWDGGSPRPLFPRARYLVQRSDWEAFAARPEEARVAFDRCVRPLADLGVAELLDGDRTLDPVLSVLHTPGHTPGSQSLLVRSGAAAVLLWGDVANHPAQVDRPDWGPGSDALPEVARQTRRRLLDRLETEAIWLAPSHFPEPFGTVTRDADGRHWTGRR
jgi:glyoxylase-like metal-dependent hydrolase (beta-lactamase superfamily II)